MNVITFRRSLKALRKAVGKDNIPASWLEFFLLIAERGDDGVEVKELTNLMGWCQASTSRTLKLMSRFYNSTKKRTDGLGLVTAVPDHVHRGRLRVFLSVDGKKVIQNFKKNLTELEC